MGNCCLPQPTPFSPDLLFRSFSLDNNKYFNYFPEYLNIYAEVSRISSLKLKGCLQNSQQLVEA